MADHVLEAAARRCNDPQRVTQTIGYLVGMADPADVAAAAAALRADWDEPFRMWYRVSAPEMQPEESLGVYARRLPQTLKRFSPTWSGQNFYRLDDAQLAAQAPKLHADIVERFQRPEAGERSYTTRDVTGREITRFFCAEDACWLPFTNAIADNGEVLGFKVGRFNRSMGRGEDGPEARDLAARLAAHHAAGAAALARENAAARG